MHAQAVTAPPGSLLTLTGHANAPDDDVVAAVAVSSTAPPIHDTLLNRMLVLCALKTTVYFYHRPHAYVIPISRHLVVKTHSSVDLAEAATMQFLATHTTLPVPRVHCAFKHGGRTYIAVERIQGTTLVDAWPTLSEAERTRVLAHLRKLLAEMRALPAPSDQIASCIGGSLFNSSIPHTRGELRFGPFASAQQFHVWLRLGFQLADLHEGMKDRDRIEKMIRQQDGPWPRPIFTHGDLNPANIMVRDGQVVGILDWEYGGWYPPYWEYTSAFIGNQTRPVWQDKIPQFLDPPCHGELEMDITREVWWGEG